MSGASTVRRRRGGGWWRSSLILSHLSKWIGNKARLLNFSLGIYIIDIYSSGIAGSESVYHRLDRLDRLYYQYLTELAPYGTRISDCTQLQHCCLMYKICYIYSNSTALCVNMNKILIVCAVCPGIDSKIRLHTLNQNRSAICFHPISCFCTFFMLVILHLILN